MVYFRKRLPEAVINDCNERFDCHCLNVIRSAKFVDHQGLGNRSSSVIESDREGKEADGSGNQGSLLIDATCVPADIRYPIYLSLLN